jgi:hypothetical protein
MTSSTLQITPRTGTSRARGAVFTAETTPGLAAPTMGPAAWQALQRASQPDYFGWLEHVRAAAGCTRPIRLVGDLYTVRRTGTDTAVVLGARHTDELPDSAIYKACGNRRASVCPACSKVYQYDAYQLIRAGLVGGKGVPDTVAQHPAVFPTLTAPSFGLVHTRVVKKHTCTRRNRCDCRAEPCHARTGKGAPGICQHGRPAVCFARHEESDPRLGQPLCLDCYDYDHHVVWNLYSGKLWHRTKDAAERYLRQLAKQRGVPTVITLSAGGTPVSKPPTRVSHGKVGEMQRRGAVHFHALLRLDGRDLADADAVIPPPPGFTAQDLEDAIEHAAARVAFTTPAHPAKPEGWRIAWGGQVLTKHVNMGGEQDLTDAAVAGYLAKYATKSTEATGHTSTRITPDNVGQYADPEGDHVARLIDACWRLGRPLRVPVPLSQRPISDGRSDTYVSNPNEDSPYAGLRRWAHMLGYGGHFLTKAQRYSVTFAQLRAARTTYRRPEHHHDHHDDYQADAGVIRTTEHDQQTTLVVGLLTFAGTGWHTTGDALLANTSAAMARARRRLAHEDLAHEIGSTLNATGRTERAA